jgi:glycerophosphoryl diester phosphodiesterase
MIIAHRGVSFTLPENSIPAFEASWQFDVDGIEGDFRLSKDGEIVCIHDDDTERVCKTKEIIHQSTLQDLKKLELYHEGDSSLNLKIPTLAEVIKTVPEGKKIFIEIKCGPEILTPLLNQLSHSEMSSDDIVIISFHSEVIKELKALNPVFKAFFLYSCEDGRDIDGLIDEAININANGISTDNESSKLFVDKVIDAGLEYHSWTIDDADVAIKLIEWGASSITTNDPESIINRIQG